MTERAKELKKKKKMMKKNIYYVNFVFFKKKMIHQLDDQTKVLTKYIVKRI